VLQKIYINEIFHQHSHP